MSVQLEVGMTYRKKGQYFLAVDKHSLVTCEAGSFRSLHPYRRYQLVRDVTVEKLCQIWGIKISRLDELSERYFTPRACRDSQPSLRTAQRRHTRRTPGIRVGRLAS